MINSMIENISVKKLIDDFNHSDFRMKSIPQEMVPGWPCLEKIGKTICLTLPFFSRRMEDDGRVALFPIWCSVTVPIGNPDRILDFTIYPMSKKWSDTNYEKPVGYFKHEALKDVTKTEYISMRDELYGYIDEMAKAVYNGVPFKNAKAASELFKKLMEPGLYPYYLRINQKFYSFFCREGGDV